MIKKQLLAFILTVGFGVVTLTSVGAPEAAPVKKKMPLYPQIEFATTEGNFTVELNGRRAPVTVRNFYQYVQNGHYDGTVFHRVIPGFMAQGGGYDKDFAEKPTVTPIPNESGNGLSNSRGTIAMARVNDPHSATAQFYINLVDNKMLDPNQKRWGYTVFGEVTNGMDVLDKIAAIPTENKAPFGADVPTKTIVITRASVLEPPAK